MKRLFLSLFLTFFLIILSAGYWATGMFYPDRVQLESFVNNGNTTILKNKQTIKVMSWNIQFMTGNKNNHYFFDQGPDLFPEEAVNHQTISNVARIITQEDPDIILLQEVDQNSQRTHYIDELKELMEQLPKTYQSHSCTPYHKVNFLPHKQMPGRIQLMLCTISKFKINKALRYALPSKLNENFINQQFHPKRAILQTDISIDNNSTLAIFNTHFSAFAPTSTLEQQGVIANEILLNAERQGPALLAGDFNSLSSTQFFHFVHPQEQTMFSPDQVPIDPLIKHFKMFPSVIELSSPDYEKWLSYMPARDHTHKPYITVDYMFISKQVEFKNYYVLQRGTQHISDHFPLIAEIQLSKK